MQLEGERRQRYVEAWERWKRDLDSLHRVLLDGEQMDPMHFIALLRRESHSKDRYDQVRGDILALPGGDSHESPFGDEPD